MTEAFEFNAEVHDRIKRCGIMAVVTIDDAANAVPLSRALAACGIDVIEVTLRSEAAVEAIARIRDEVPEVMVGAGTLLSPDQVDQVVGAGASFGVAPGLNADVVGQARRSGLPFAPGVMSPSEVEAALAMGCRQLKLFPADPIGGVRYLRTLVTPYEHLGVKFFVSGGVNEMNAGGYLYDSAVSGVGGAWIAPRKLIQTQNWSAVIDNATEARAVVKEAKVR